MNKHIGLLIIICLLINLPQAKASYEPVYANNGIVASPEPNATKVGIEILKEGGNAFDAAVAVGFALAVTYPAAGNVGGGGFMVAHKADGSAFFLDFREMAPLAAHRDLYLDDAGNVIEGLSTDSMLAVGVPGTVHGLLTALQDHGTMKRSRVMNPAIELAKKGFSISYSQHQSFKYSAERLMKFASTQKAFYVDGKAPEFGDRLIQKDLAKTLTRIKQDGMEGFYARKTAELITAYMLAHGGIITKDDLANYQSKYREPIVFDYKGYHLITPSLPSSGGVTLAQMLKMLEPFDLPSMGYHSAQYIQAIIESERLAFADRNHFLGDADFVEVPVAELISEDYINQRRKLISFGKAGSSRGVQHGTPESEQTTHYCVADQYGNVAAVTYTLNNSYGMGAVVEGAGFLLNNEMDDFSAKPGEPNMYGLTGTEANAIAPGKRMLSSMTPTIVLKDNKFDFTIGTPGGPTIITTVAQVILNKIEFGMNIREAIDAPRFHHQWLPDEVFVEPFAFSPDTKALLHEKGYILQQRNSLGFAIGIEAMENGMKAGYADGRGEGSALGH